MPTIRINGGHTNSGRRNRVFARWINFTTLRYACTLVGILIPLQLGADSHNVEYTLVEGDVITSSQFMQRSLGARQAAQLWPDGIVPYTIDPDLPPKSIDAIQQAINVWNEVSVITLKPVADILAADASLTTATLDYVKFQSGEGCASWVGRRGGEQAIWVAENCTVGSMMHEIGHVIGLEHEHTRPDRDDYINIHWENIVPEKRHNFDVATSASQPLGEYDYESIMHYGPTNFSLEGLPTISPIFGSSSVIGQRDAPSTGDLEGVAALYATDLSLVAHLYPLDSVWQAAIHVTNNQSQGAHDIVVSIDLLDAELAAFSDNGWICEIAAVGQSTCRKERLAAGELSTLLLNYNAIKAPYEMTATLESKTHDANSLNNKSLSVLSSDGPPDVEPRYQDDQIETIYTASVLMKSLIFLFLLTLLKMPVQQLRLLYATQK